MVKSSQLIEQVGLLIEQRTGIAFYPALRESLDGILYPGLLDDLRHQDESAAIWQTVLSALTIGETYFLRDRAHFDLLHTRILPGLIQQRRASDDLHLNLWSVGCATGEEPYSIAITLRDLLPDIDRWQVVIYGTDINAHALHAARRGVYRQWSFRGTDEDFQQRHFEAVEGGLRLKPAIQQMVTLQQGNLLNQAGHARFDVIFCRNVLLYFNDTRQAENTLYDALLPGGWLIMGQAERLKHVHEGWSAVAGVSAYQKRLHSAGVRAAAALLAPSSPADADPATGAAMQVLQTMMESAVIALQQEDIASAGVVIEEVLRAYPSHAPAYVLRAYVCASQQQPAAAHAALDSGLALDPLLADGHYLRAILHLEANRGESKANQAAHQALYAALYCQRDHALAAFTLGNLHAQTGELPEAARLWRRALNAIVDLPASSPVSVISSITAGQLRALLQENLD